MKRLKLHWIGAASALLLSWSAQAVDLKVGFVTSMSGPVSSIGIPYAKGIKAAEAFKAEVNGVKLQLIQLDDASDPSAASRNARKLVDEDKVDVLIGSAGVPGAMAIAAVARDSKTPMIGITPMPIAGDENPWVVTTAQPVPLMIGAVMDRMKADGVKNVAYIGFSDSWGDLVYDGLTKGAAPLDIKVLTNERYARADNSVAGQTLKIVASRPEGVMTGGSGTPGALPYLALAERGYKGKLYGTHALINPDFVRVAGASAEGLLAPTGPIIVAEQLPADYPTRKISMAFREVYQRVHSQPTTDGFSAYAFDAWLVLADAVARVNPKLKPGTPEYREALRDAIYTTKELVGTHGVYNFKRGSISGVDKRARVMVQLDKGQWKYVP